MIPILATDLDGTFIPGDSLPAEHPQHQALEVIRQRIHEETLEVVYVTGRHLASVLDIIRVKDLPRPGWIICDVGTSIFHREGSAQQSRAEQQPYRPVQAYVNHLDQVVGAFSTAQLQRQVATGGDLRLQEAEKQGRHKLSYYCDAAALPQHVETLAAQLQKLGAPYQIISSIDPFNGDGLIDLLPRGADKASALLWWCQARGQSPEGIVFAGDSGNDYAALTTGFRAILVGNACRELAQRVAEHHRRGGHAERLYLAREHATAGVLEGCRRFGLF